MKLKRPNNKAQRNSPAEPLDLRDQVKAAFSKPKERSGVIHGVRRIHQGAVGRRTGLFPSVKNDAVVATESKLETAHCLTLERTPLLEAYRLQALAVRTSVASTQYPDALLQWSDGTLGAREVKPSPQSLTPSTRQSLERVAAALELSSIPYEIVYGAQIPSDVELWNLKWLYSRGNCKRWSAMELEVAMGVWRSNDAPITLGTFWNQLCAASTSPLIAEYLIFHRFIFADLDKHLASHSWLQHVALVQT